MSRKRSVSMDKALAVIPRLERELERVYQTTCDQGLTQTQHLERKRVWRGLVRDNNLPRWAEQQLYGYDRALYRQQERDTVFAYQCPETGTFYTTHKNLCPGLDVYPQDKVREVPDWKHGKVWRKSHLPFFGDICNGK